MNLISLKIVLSPSSARNWTKFGENIVIPCGCQFHGAMTRGPRLWHGYAMLLTNSYYSFLGKRRSALETVKTVLSSPEHLHCQLFSLGWRSSGSTSLLASEPIC